MPNLSSVSYATGVSGPSVSPSAVITVAAGSSASPSVGVLVGAGGWPVHVASFVGPQRTAGGVMGLPEQASGTTQPTVTGIAEPTVVSRRSRPFPDVVNEQPAPTIPAPAVGEPAKAAEEAGGGKANPLLKLLPYTGTGTVVLKLS